jgi:hypothetical protein
MLLTFSTVRGSAAARQESDDKRIHGADIANRSLLTSSAIHDR